VEGDGWSLPDSLGEPCDVGEWSASEGLSQRAPRWWGGGRAGGEGKTTDRSILATEGRGRRQSEAYGLSRQSPGQRAGAAPEGTGRRRIGLSWRRRGGDADRVKRMVSFSNLRDRGQGPRPRETWGGGDDGHEGRSTRGGSAALVEYSEGRRGGYGVGHGRRGEKRWRRWVGFGRRS
jgi:hypothetical protein